MVKVKAAFPVLLTVSLLAMVACDSDDDNGASGTEEAATTAAEDDSETSGKPILIKTRLAPVNARGETTGEVLPGSTIGDSAFCVGGQFGERKEPGSDLVTRMFRCSGGVVTITFTSTPPDVRQRSDWKVVKGLAGFDGLTGGGRMRAISESKNGEGREVFTGTVAR